MTEKLHAVVHATTNHILAAAAGPDEAGTAPDADTLFGDTLLIRDPETGDPQITVAAEHLKAQEITFREDILFTPSRFVIVDGLPEHKDEFDSNDLSVNRTEIQVDRPNNALPEDALTFWLQLESDQYEDPIVQVVNLPKDELSVVESTVLLPGDYRVLMLGPQHRATVIEFNVA